MSFEIVPFSDDYLGDAASLVAMRYRGQRALQPSLPARFERSDGVLPRLQDLAMRGTGVAAIRGGRCVVFLLGIPYLAGGARTVWSPDWGHAVDSVDGPDTYRGCTPALPAGGF